MAIAAVGANPRPHLDVTGSKKYVSYKNRAAASAEELVNMRGKASVGENPRAQLEVTGPEKSDFNKNWAAAPTEEHINMTGNSFNRGKTTDLSVMSRDLKARFL